MESPNGRRTLWRPIMIEQMLSAQKRERDIVLAEAVKIQGLMPLLMKRRNGMHWSADDRHLLGEQLHAMAHISPYLAVLVLPGSFIVLPVLAWWLDRRRGRRGEN